MLAGYTYMGIAAITEKLIHTKIFFLSKKIINILKYYYYLRKRDLCNKHRNKRLLKRKKKILVLI